MAHRDWRGRRGLASIGEVLDRGSGKRLVGRQRVWRQLIGRALGEATAFVDVTGEGVLRVMARNDAIRREILARKDHILAAWNMLAAARQAQSAESMVCWVNPRVGRKQEAGTEGPAGRKNRAPGVSGHPDEGDDLAAVLERIRLKRDAASRHGPDAP